MRIKFDKDPSAVEQNNYAAIVINAYIVFELDTLPKILLNSFKFKKCLFGGRNTVRRVMKLNGFILLWNSFCQSRFVEFRLQFC